MAYNIAAKAEWGGFAKLNEVKNGLTEIEAAAFIEKHRLGIRHFLTIFGETKTISAWSRDPRCRVERRTLAARINNGWEAKEAIERFSDSTFRRAAK